MSISSAIAFIWIVHDPTDDKSTMVEVNGLAPSGNKPLPQPRLTQTYVGNYGIITHNELTKLNKTKPYQTWRHLSYLGELCLLYGHNLHGHHRQHLDVNTVELVKTCPGTRTELATQVGNSTQRLEG